MAASPRDTTKSTKSDIEDGAITWDLISLVEEKRGKISARKEEQREKERKRLQDIKLQGFLNKRVNMVQGWHRRFFVLTNGELKYARRENSKKFITIPLLNAVLLKQRGKKTTRFVVDSGTIVAQLRAKNQDERAKWLDALTEVKQLLNNLHRTEEKSEGDLGVSGPIPYSNTMATSHNLIPTTTTTTTTVTTTSHIEPLAKMRDCMSRMHKAREAMVAIIGPNFDGTLDGGKSVKKDVLKELSPNLQELFNTIDKLEEEVEIVTASLLEQIDALKDQNKPGSTAMFEMSDAEPEEDEETSDSETSEEFFDAEENWSQDESNDGNSSMKKSGKDEESSSTNSESDEFFKDLSPEGKVRKSQDLRKSEGRADKTPTGKAKQNKGSKSLVQTLILAQMPSRLSLMSNFEASLITIPQNFKARERLPHNKDFIAKISLGKILKDTIGKDLTRLSIPVVFSEPLSLLQRLAEEHEYGDLLSIAATKEDSCLRLAYAAAFAVSSYSSTIGRFTKPFNPLLGETFEFIHKKREFRLIAEQVSHHPPVSACFAEGREWTMWGHAFVKLKFWGKSMEVFPDGFITAEIAKFQDKFVWNKVTTVVNNLIVGTKWIDHYGDMMVINQNTGDKCKVNFEKTGWFSNQNGKIEGIVYNSKNTPRYKLEGSWQNSVKCTPFTETGEMDVSRQFVIWEKDPLPEWSKDQFQFTSLAIQCNELADYMRPVLPVTDSRWRPDQRAFENGDVDLAQAEKTRLEERQRARRAARGEVENWEPRWFTKEGYTYKGGYWEQRLAGKFTNVGDIFEMELDRGDKLITQPDNDAVINSNSTNLRTPKKRTASEITTTATTTVTTTSTTTATTTSLATSSSASLSTSATVIGNSNSNRVRTSTLSEDEEDKSAVRKSRAVESSSLSDKSDDTKKRKMRKSTFSEETPNNNYNDNNNNNNNNNTHISNDTRTSRREKSQ